MPYDEQSFLNGLAAGLTATAGRSLGIIHKYGFGTDVPMNPESPGEFYTFTSKFCIQTPYPLTIVYAYGLLVGTRGYALRRVSPSNHVQTLWHEVQLPKRLDPGLTYYTYDISFLASKSMVQNIGYWGGISHFPMERGWPPGWIFYPGAPELVSSWHDTDRMNYSLLNFG